MIPDIPEPTDVDLAEAALYIEAGGVPPGVDSFEVARIMWWLRQQESA